MSAFPPIFGQGVSMQQQNGFDPFQNENPPEEENNFYKDNNDFNDGPIGGANSFN